MITASVTVSQGRFSKSAIIRMAVFAYFFWLALALIWLQNTIGTDDSLILDACAFWLLVLSISGITSARYKGLSGLFRSILTGMFRLAFLALCFFSIAATETGLRAFAVVHNSVNLLFILAGSSVIICLVALIVAHFRRNSNN